jgi:hypothetical protein
LSDLIWHFTKVNQYQQNQQTTQMGKWWCWGRKQLHFITTELLIFI